MSYLGNAPARSFISFERQVFTIVNSQTAYALSHSVTNENDIRLVVNNVVQEPGSGKAYTATGTALTLSAALTNGTDEMYCVFLGRATATSAPGAGSIGTAQLADLNVTSGKIANDAVTLAKMASGTDGNIISYDASGNPVAVATGNDGQVLTSTGAGSPPAFETLASATNAPYFRAYNNADFSFSQSSTTKMRMNVVEFESNNGSFDTSNYRFTVPNGEGGKYFIGAILYIYAGTDSYAAGYIFKNNSEFLICDNIARDDYSASSFVQINALMNLSAGDYIDVRCNANKSSPVMEGSTGKNSNFYGYKLIG